MIPEKVFHQILALGNAWRVSRVDYQDKERKVVIRVEDTPALWPTQKCPFCGCATVRGYDHAPERTWRYLNVCQLESEIASGLPRGECQDCRRGFTVKAAWEGRSRGLTQEFEGFALTLMREMPVSKAGEILGETDHKLWRPLFAHVDAAWAALSRENVVWVGADEMNRRKGHNYLTVFVDLEAKRVLLAVEGKDASVWERFAAELFKHNGHPKTARVRDWSRGGWPMSTRLCERGKSSQSSRSLRKQSAGMRWASSMMGTSILPARWTLKACWTSWRSQRRSWPSNSIWKASQRIRSVL
jgi:transposase